MLNYTLKDLIPNLSSDEEKVIQKYPIATKEDWTKGQYEKIKQRIKEDLYFNQNDRCAYCRIEVEAAAKYEPLDHIVAKSIKPQWMLIPKNLIVVCDSCNNLKNADNTLSEEYIGSENFPDCSDAFIIFNPHFDNWQDHFTMEKDLFLLPVPNSKGRTTIKMCRLDRYNCIINRSKELQLRQKEPIERIVQKISELDMSSEGANELMQELLKAIKFYNKRSLDNERYN